LGLGRKTSTKNAKSREKRHLEEGRQGGREWRGRSAVEGKRVISKTIEGFSEWPTFTDPLKEVFAAAHTQKPVVCNLEK